MAKLEVFSYLFNLRKNIRINQKIVLDHWSVSCHHQKIQEHFVRDPEAGCVQEPSLGHLHRVRRGQDRGSVSAGADGGCQQVQQS